MAAELSSDPATIDLDWADGLVPPRTTGRQPKSKAPAQDTCLRTQPRNMARRKLTANISHVRSAAAATAQPSHPKSAQTSRANAQTPNSPSRKS